MGLRLRSILDGRVAGLLLGSVLLCQSSGLASEDLKALEFFEARIRPVLVKHCYECHSSDARELKGNLLVDSATGLRRGGDSGPALVPGEPRESLLIAALRYESFEMPPAGRLAEKVIQDFEEWVRRGAVDPREGVSTASALRGMNIEEGRQFWAFQPVRPADLPVVQGSAWPQNWIDHFVLARLEAAGLQPAPDAGLYVLARRLYYDLIGLPPTSAQLQAFRTAAEADRQAALATLVDELLESPQFGVHWGRHWLDVARYADSNGGDFNATFHDAWRYRDYVVEALNEDKPYDQFVCEQIAGDLLPYTSEAQRAEQLTATGFLMIGTKMLSERDKTRLYLDVADEQINTVGQAFLGLTLGCARCHDHKFDPIPTNDYYALAGIFMSTRTLEGESQQYVSTWRPVDLPAAAEHVARVRAHEERTKKLTAALEQAKKLHEHAATQLKQLAAGERAITIDDTQAEIAGDWKTSTFSPHYVGAGYIHDDQTDKGRKSVEFTFEVPHSAEYEVRLSYTAGKNRARRVPVIVRHARGVSERFVDQTRRPPIDNLFTPLGRFSLDAAQPASVVVTTTGTRGHVIVDAVQFVPLDDQGEPLVSVSAADEELVHRAQAQVAERQAELERIDRQLKELETDSPPPLPQAFAASDLSEVSDCAICIRGEHENLGPVVPRGFVQVAATEPAPRLPGDQSGRLQLARWLASPDHPLTARVMVNRIWQHLIGEGIVRSPDNFGMLGQRPSHPRLLDRLALEFMQEGWSIKHVVRSVVLSHTYQMSSQHRAGAARIDAENRLLWRAHRRPLPAEAIRDSLLVISGQLDLAPGGSPVEGLGTLVTTNNADTEDYQQAQSLKRSLYLPIIRNELPAILTVFDFADPDLVTGKRPVTNVPAQALLLMNSPFVMDCAERTTELLLDRGERSQEQLVQQLYQRILGRPATREEQQQCLAFLGDLPEGSGLTRLIQILVASTEFRFLD